MPNVTLDNVVECFTYHPPDGEQQVLYHTIQEETVRLAKTILELCPESREKALAITKLQEARMWANASIALKGVKTSDLS